MIITQGLCVTELLLHFNLNRYILSSKCWSLHWALFSNVALYSKNRTPHYMLNRMHNRIPQLWRYSDPRIPTEVKWQKETLNCSIGRTYVFPIAHHFPLFIYRQRERERGGWDEWLRDLFRIIYKSKSYNQGSDK